MQHFLKTPPGATRARIITAELFTQLDLTAFNSTIAPFDVRLRWETLTPFRTRLESKGGLRGFDSSS